MEDTKMTNKDFESIRDRILARWEKRDIVFASVGGLHFANIDEFIKQPEEGILYDLNRSEAVVLTLINDPKWINDFAVCKTIRVLKARIDELEKQLEAVKDL